MGERENAQSCRNDRSVYVCVYAFSKGEPIENAGLQPPPMSSVLSAFLCGGSIVCVFYCRCAKIHSYKRPRLPGLDIEIKKKI